MGAVGARNITYFTVGGFVIGAIGTFMSWSSA